MGRRRRRDEETKKRRKQFGVGFGWRRRRSACFHSPSPRSQHEEVRIIEEGKTEGKRKREEKIERLFRCFVRCRE